MPTPLPNDGLLRAARLLTGFFQIVLAIAFAALLIAIPALLLSQEHIADEMLVTATASTDTVAASVAGVLLLGAAMIALGYVFLRVLKQIINSVGEGDPFILENAERLRKMGWIAVMVELLKLPAHAIAAFIATQVKEDTFTIDLDLSFTGLLIALVLCILARVFRHGAAMRADLEGTV